MFFLVRHDRQTFVIDLEPYRVDGQLAYKFDQTFDLARNLKPLSSLEARLPQVNAALHFEIDASTCASGGMLIKPIKYGRITDPLPKNKQGDIGDIENVDGDIGEDADFEKTNDVCSEGDASSERMVDTDVESTTSNSSCEAGGDDNNLIKPPVPATLDPLSTAVAEATYTHSCTTKERERRDILWENIYFYISETKGWDGIQGIRIRMRSCVTEIGSTQLSKHMTPRHFGETLESCPVTLLLLRAWSVWRVHRDGWARARERRKRDFYEIWLQLLSDIDKVQHNDGSLGNTAADSTWQSYKEPILKFMRG